MTQNMGHFIFTAFQNVISFIPLIVPHTHNDPTPSHTGITNGRELVYRKYWEYGSFHRNMKEEMFGQYVLE